MRKRNRGIAFGALALLWIVLLFYLSGMDSTSSGSLSLWVTQRFFGWMTRFGLSLAALHAFVRKLAHFGVFFIEGFFVFEAFSAFLSRGKALFMSLLLCAGLAVANELHQTTAVGRACSPVDMLIDFSGSAICALIACAGSAWIAKHRRGQGADIA
ncbi:MAG: VanZ family protein [Clostridia bacterium]|nr:VanZ family protein [Clostridia bacterium]